MIPQPECSAVFLYAYRPLTNEFKMFESDAGFTLTVFQDGHAVFSMLNHPGYERERYTYQLDEAFLTKYQEILEHADHWLQAVQPNIRTTEDRVAPYTATFGFSGYQLITCDEPARLLRMRLGTPQGYQARRLCALFEDVTMLLGSYGIHLEFDRWKSDVKEEHYWNDTQSWQPRDVMGL